MLINHQTKIDRKGCWRLLTDMTTAFFGKNYEEGKDNIETGVQGFVQTFVGVPIALFWGVVLSPVKLFSKEAEEGTCNVGEESNPKKIIAEFVSLYEKKGFPNKKSQISIVVPEK